MEQKKSILANLVDVVAVDRVLSIFSNQNSHLLSLPFDSVYRTNNRSGQYVDDSCRNIAILDDLKHFWLLSFFNAQENL